MIFDHRSAYLASELYIAFRVRLLVAVIAPEARSLTLTAELSGARGIESCAIVTVASSNSAEESANVNAFFSRIVTSYCLGRLK